MLVWAFRALELVSRLVRGAVNRAHDNNDDDPHGMHPVFNMRPVHCKLNVWLVFRRLWHN
jgi:hypothetical protein